MGRWTEIDHTADLALHIWATDLEDLFTTAARGMFQLLTGDVSIESSHQEFFSLAALDVETLLVDWLNELLYLNEVKGLVFDTFAFDKLSPTRLRAQIRGALVREYINYIKAATFHNLEILKTEDGYETEIVFDT
ncbi:MAG: archease [Anaerolineae bacterium]|nr:archease [Anaerolineae bacterium]